MRKSLFCIPLVSLCSLFCLLLTGCGGGGNPLPPPAQVTGLGANRPGSDPGLVQLAWSPGSPRATKGYLVARKFEGEAETAPFIRLTTTPITTAAFTDRLPAGKEIMTPVYQVVAVDRKDRVGTPGELTVVVSAPDGPGSDF